MFKKNGIVALYFKYSLACAILFCIPMFIFLSDQTYTKTWLLYLGNALFLVGVFVFMVFFNNRKNENASTQTMMVAGHTVTIMGMIIAFIIAFIAALVLVPSAFGMGASNNDLANAPQSMDRDVNDGLLFVLFADTILGNIAAGSFVSLITAYSYKRDQVRDKAKI
jgi:hypothetical protein